MSEEDKKDGYEVGYGRPPKHTQFKPGQSGNSKGRPKRRRNIKTDLEAALQEKITYSENGTPKTADRQQLLILTLLAKAIKGDHKATDTVLRLAGVYDAEAPEVDVPFTDGEQSVFDDFLDKAAVWIEQSGGGDDEPE